MVLCAAVHVLKALATACLLMHAVTALRLSYLQAPLTDIGMRVHSRQLQARHGGILRPQQRLLPSAFAPGRE